MPYVSEQRLAESESLMYSLEEKPLRTDLNLRKIGEHLHLPLEVA
jgi:hypothetical protein